MLSYYITRIEKRLPQVLNLATRNSLQAYYDALFEPTSKQYESDDKKLIKRLMYLNNEIAKVIDGQ